jgi:hypothetical protein
MQSDRDKQIGGLALIAIALLIIAALLVSERVRCAESVPEVGFEWATTTETAETKIGSWLEIFFARCNPRKLDAAKKLIPSVVEAAQEHGVNPYLVAAMVSLESSWQPIAVGKLGEIGLLQVMGSDAKTVEEQLDHGLTILVAAHAECGSTIGAVSKYATGRSCKPYRGARLRLRMAARIEGL